MECASGRKTLASPVPLIHSKRRDWARLRKLQLFCVAFLPCDSVASLAQAMMPQQARAIAFCAVLAVAQSLQTPPRKKVVVVGAGWAGLSTAWTLSKNNVDVTLVDAAARPGGVVRDGFKTRGGRPAEAGQHGFWEEYFNIYKLLYDELKLEEDPLTAVWKPNFGGPTPSMRCCLCSCICSMAWI